jgi:tRNA pseudouridine55 synthase
MMLANNQEGILLVNKAKNSTSFDLIRLLRKRLQTKKIGHCGTLDPMATGVMILLIGKKFTKQSSRWLNESKTYEACLCLGKSTTTYDLEGSVTTTSSVVPTLSQIREVLLHFQGTISQTAPMFSAKKHSGKPLYTWARRGVDIERKPHIVEVQTTLVSYHYPHLNLRVHCSKGTYIRSMAQDIGQMLGSYAHLYSLKRTHIGQISLDQCIEQKHLLDPMFRVQEYLTHEDSLSR